MKQSHYFNPGQDLDHELNTITYTINQHCFEFTTDRGVFSRNRVDYGTNVMLNAVFDEMLISDLNLGNCLDLGCGYGVVSIVLSTLFPEQKWLAVDINPRAVELTKLNATKYDLPIEVLLSDGIIDKSTNFDLILTNPPIRSGKKNYYRLFKEVSEVLSENGIFYTVIQKKQGSASAVKFLRELFADVVIIDKTGGYHTIRCRQPF